MLKRARVPLVHPERVLNFAQRDLIPDPKPTPC
jgi:hypothetical protein